MKKLCLILSSIILVLSVQANSIVFDTLGPNASYNCCLAYNVGFGAYGGPYETAAQFAALTSGRLATVDLGLTFSSDFGKAGVAEVFLYANSNGMPDNGSQMFLGLARPSSVFGTTDNTLESFAVSRNVAVNAGSIYWLVLKPRNPNETDTWNTSLVAGSVDQSTDDSTWFPSSGADNLLPAFRLTASRPPPVSDSGTTILLMAASITALATARVSKWSEHREIGQP